jgi:hypothetical protein
MSTVTMQLPAGMDVPSVLYLNDGSKVIPNASGQIVVATKFIGLLLNAGWQIVVGSGTTHVP